MTKKPMYPTDTFLRIFVGTLWVLAAGAIILFFSSCAPRNMRIAQPDVERCPTRLGGSQYAWVKVGKANPLSMDVDVRAIGTWQEWVDTAAVHGGHAVHADMRIGVERWHTSIVVLMSYGDTTEVGAIMLPHKYHACTWWEGTAEGERFMWVDKHTAALWRGRLKNMRNQP